MPVAAPAHPPFALFVTDIDNTLFDWVAYYGEAFTALLHAVEDAVQVPFATLAGEAQQVFVGHNSIEYPFLVQELPSVIKHCGDDIGHMLRDIVGPARSLFNQVAEPHLKPYPGVLTALQTLRTAHPTVPFVALTDAPRYVAMWKLNKLGLLSFFDAVYGLPDPRVPVHAPTNQVKVDNGILIKHLQKNAFNFAGKVRVLPEDYEKPGRKGLKTVLMDYDLDEPFEAARSVLWIGDNKRKDVALGKLLGVYTAWAAYGLPKPENLAQLLAFSPVINVQKHAALPVDTAGMPEPDVVLQEFADIVGVF